ncbi:hypothetical protein PQX77_017863 [Marasmius sp. AFHP31]|nr:hypothetical protein PQX77_017863 [Marasmius sp. AFHP31]
MFSPLFRLPNETLEEIAFHCSDSRKGNDAKNLRLTCRRVNAVTERVLWETRSVLLFLEQPNRLCSRTIRMLEDFKDGTCSLGATRWIKNIKVIARASYHRCSCHEFGETHLTDVVDYGLLTSALRALRNIRRVKCRIGLIHTPQSSFTERKVMDTLATLPLVSEFLVTYIRPPLNHSIPLDKLGNGHLQKLVINGSFRVAAPEDNYLGSLSDLLARNPRISHLELILDDLTRPFCFSDLFQHRPYPHILRLQTLILNGWSLECNSGVIPHLQSLQRLELHSGIVVEPELWTAFKDHGISLRHLHTCQINEELLEYLNSFSALETLVFNHQLAPGPDTEESRTISRRFFERVLPHHNKTLQILRVQPFPDACEWGVGLWNVEVLKALRRLEVLEIAPSMLEDHPVPESRRLMNSLVELALDLPFLRTLQLNSNIARRPYLADTLASTRLSRSPRTPESALRIVALPVSTMWYTPWTVEEEIGLRLQTI